MSKTDLAARPMFVRRRDAIEAHLTIAFTALAVARETQARTGLAIRNVIRQLRPLRSATIEVNGGVQTFPPGTSTTPSFSPCCSAAAWTMAGWVPTNTRGLSTPL
jgi:hypothetical protein